MHEEYRDFEIETFLQPLPGESFDNKSTITEDGARLDIEADVLWATILQEDSPI